MLRSFQIIFLVVGYMTSEAFAQSPNEIQTWAYWLQDIDLDQLRASSYDLVVIDYSADGSQNEAFSTEEITALKTSGKTVLAYLSIGEAEEGRFYFQSSWVQNGRKTINAPKWLSHSNPDFPDNFKVQFWNRNWQRIIFGNVSGDRQSYLDRIISAGFDGVYLDIIDAFEDRRLRKALLPNGRIRGIKKNAKAMIQFVLSLSQYARLQDSNFQIYPQNGAAIINNVSSTLRQKYLDAINGIGAEDSFYFGGKDQDNPLNPQDDVIALLDSYVAAGKRVLAIDYLLDSDKILDFQAFACEHEFIPQVSNRDLDTLEHHRDLACSAPQLFPLKRR